MLPVELISTLVLSTEEEVTIVVDVMIDSVLIPACNKYLNTPKDGKKDGEVDL